MNLFNTRRLFNSPDGRDADRDLMPALVFISCIRISFVFTRVPQNSTRVFEEYDTRYGEVV